MFPVFPFAHIVTAVLLLIVGFLFHWIGQLISVINWALATRLGLQEKDMPQAYRVYEHAIAVADVAVGWTYGLTAVGLLLRAPWGFRLACVPGAVLIYHAVSAWVWEGNRRKAGAGMWSNAMRVGWCTANLVTGCLALLCAWAGG